LEEADRLEWTQWCSGFFLHAGGFGVEGEFACVWHLVVEASGDLVLEVISEAFLLDTHSHHLLELFKQITSIHFLQRSARGLLALSSVQFLLEALPFDGSLVRALSEVLLQVEHYS
jgi:hypothetical protein